ncbi:hypothetical protein DIPPA_13246 [Diplonema papillatum]|nr:hypothetical protein DIPPA_13246 [Diplonema papillatum]
MQVPSQSPMSRGAQFPSQPAQFQSQGAQHSRSSRPAFLSQGVQPSKMSSLSQGDRMSAPASLLSQTVQMMQFPSQSARRASHGVQHSGPGAFSQGNQYSGPGAMSQGNQYSMPGVLSQGNQYSGPGAISQGNQFSMPVGAMSQGNQYSGPGAMSQGNQFSMPGAMSQGNQYSGPGAMSQGNQFSMPGALSQGNQYSGPGALSETQQFPSQALDQESVGVQHSKNTTRFPSQAMQFPSQAAGQQSQGVPGDSSPLNFTSEGVQFPSQAPQVQSQGIQGSPAFDYSAQPSGILDGKSTLNAITSPRRNMNDLVNAWKQHAIEFEQALIDHKAQLNMIGSNLASTATRLNPPRVQAPEATGNSIAQPSATSLRQTESDGEEAGDADEEAATEPAVEEMDTHEDPPPPSDPESMHTDDVNVITGQDELQDTFVNVFNQMRDACELPKVRYDVFCKEQAQAAADTIATGNDANLEEGVLSHQGPTDDPTEAVETAVNAWFSDFGNMIVPSPDVTHVGVAIVDDYVVAYCMPVS